MPDAQQETVPDEPVEPESLSLAADFPTPTRDEWRKLVSAVLAKSGVEGDPEQALSHVTYDGITIKPLYTAGDAHDLDASGLPGHPPFVRGATSDAETTAEEDDSGSLGNGWDVRTRHVNPDATRANADLLGDLETGATSVWLVIGPNGIAVNDLGVVLKDVYLELAPIALDAGPDIEAATAALLRLARDRGVNASDLRGSLGADPIGTRARTGADVDLDVLPRLAEQGVASPGLRVATADGTVFHDAGASDAQELGVTTSVAVAYLRALVDGGLSVDDALATIDFRWAVTAEQFPSIAKLRAARRIWDRVAELSGAGDARRGQYQHAVTSSAMLTQRDPWVNLLRSTIGCFSAAVGGADAITVLPFDAAIGLPDDFSRRIARNTHAVLHDESSLARVVDAAGGSWFVETLTDQLAQKAWTVFTEIERAGGALVCLDAGTLDEMFARTRTQRDEDIAHRRAPITGVSEFAFVGEKPVERASLPADPDGVLPRIRYAQPYETLRDASDAASERPKIFLATLGPVAAHSARAGFAANLFQAGGLECVTGPVEDFAASGTSVACLCSSDKIYADDAAAAATALREAGAQRIWLAGKSDAEGIDGTLFAGCDALDIIRRTFETLGVQS